MTDTLHTEKLFYRRLKLGINEVATIRGGRGMSICCVAGQVWVTREGDARDYIVPRGLCFIAVGEGSIVINGREAGSVVEIGIAQLSGARNLARQPLRVDWERMAQIECAARNARAEHLASWMRAGIMTTKRVRGRLLKRLVDALATLNRPLFRSGDKA
jgi:uncharacterized membrane protein